MAEAGETKWSNRIGRRSPADDSDVSGFSGLRTCSGCGWQADLEKPDFPRRQTFTWTRESGIATAVFKRSPFIPVDKAGFFI
jgi:hypothetical protein